MNPNYGLMIELKPKFQRKLFTILLKKYKREDLAKILNRSPSLMYIYKNNRVNSLSTAVINKAIKLANISKKELEENTIKIYSAKKRENLLEMGRALRRNQLKDFKKEIPKIHEIVENNTLNFEKWFNRYLKLINFGARQFKSIKVKRNKITLGYTNYANSKKKEFINYLPRKIKIDEDFQYFFGLWCGDRLGSGRFGVVNKNKEINFATRNYLRKLFQKSEFILKYNSGIKKPKLSYIDKYYKEKSSIVNGRKIKGYAVLVGIKNGILFTFFNHLLKNLDEFLNLLPNKNIFFAGLFDAEGNIFLEDKCFRWACKNEKQVKIYIKYLKEIELFHRYDGCNLVTYNVNIFKKKILPFIKNPDKINKANLICYKKGNLELRFLHILNVIKEKDKITNKDLSKVLKRVKMYSQISFLEYQGYISKEGYPYKMSITNKGLREITKNIGKIK